MFGLKPSDFNTAPYELWPENLAVVQLFSSLSTQWRMASPGGEMPDYATGLDYNVLFHKMDRMTLTPEQYQDLEADIQAMESEALQTMNTKE